jgi:hypothetical protein
MLLLLIVFVRAVVHDRQLASRERLEFRLQAASTADSPHARAQLRTFADLTIREFFNPIAR